MGEIIACIFGIMLGISIGMNISIVQYQNLAIKHNVAYYDAKTSEFKWKDCK